MPSQPLPKAQRMSYRIARGEMGVLTFEPYKSEILPLWRFKTPAIARQSSSAIYAKFLAYDAADDFVGMDMSRKFLQMGMTRAKRYANHKGGRKYDKSTGEELPKGEDFEGRSEKLEASLVFREVWERAKRHEGYVAKKERFLKEQKEWDKSRRDVKVEVEEKVAKPGKKTKVKTEMEEEDEEVEVRSMRERKTKVKTESRGEGDGVEARPRRGNRTKVKTEIKEEDESE